MQRIRIEDQTLQSRIKAMAGQGPLTIRELARRVGRDVKAVMVTVRRLLRPDCRHRLRDEAAKNAVDFAPR